MTGAAILWRTDAITRLKFVDISESYGTEATPPTKREKRKQHKRNPQNWNIVVKKKKI